MNTERDRQIEAYKHYCTGEECPICKSFQYAWNVCEKHMQEKIEKLEAELDEADYGECAMELIKQRDLAKAQLKLAVDALNQIQFDVYDMTVA